MMKEDELQGIIEDIEREQEEAKKKLSSQQQAAIDAGAPVVE